MPTKQERISSFSYFVFEWLECVVIAILAVILIFTFAVHQLRVEQTSMNPNLYEGDRIVVSGLFYVPEQGDIVVFSKQSSEDGSALVKRIIAVGGQTVDIDLQGAVTIDGEVLDEPYIAGQTILRDVSFPLTVPEGYYFLMGDNRSVSLDSRTSGIGLVADEEILGKVVALFFPFSRFEVF